MVLFHVVSLVAQIKLENLLPEPRNYCDSSVKTDANGDVYSGQWNAQHPEKEGYGVLKYASGDISTYHGAWWKDKMSGYGVLTTRDGHIHYGFFEDGRRNGDGVYIFDWGKRIFGKYRAGKRVKGVLFDQNNPKHAKVLRLAIEAKARRVLTRRIGSGAIGSRFVRCRHMRTPPRAQRRLVQQME
jgi:hypothetical protein